MDLTRKELNGNADFLGDSLFQLRTNPFGDRDGDIPLGLHDLPRRSTEAHLYRLSHPLADCIVNEAKKCELLTAEIYLELAAHEAKVTIVEPLRGQSGWLSLSCFTVEALDHSGDHLLLAAVTDMDKQSTRKQRPIVNASDLQSVQGRNAARSVAVCSMRKLFFFAGSLAEANNSPFRKDRETRLFR